jgi:outer membrane protein assembly factor BamB
MKRFLLISLVLFGAVLLSACSAGASATTWPGLAADNTTAYLADGSYVYAVRLSDGSRSWQYPPAGKAGTQLFYADPVLTPDGQLLVGSASASRDNQLTSLDAATGQPKWTTPFVAGDRWVAPPLVVGDTVYAANNDGTLYALNLATGGKVWALPISRDLWGAPVTDGKLIFVSSLDHFLYAVDPQAHKVVWKVDLGGSAPGSPVVSSDGTTLYIGSFAKKLFAVDSATGSVRWTADTKDWIWSAPALGGDSLFAADISGNIYSLGAPNGKDAWPTLQPDGPITGSPLILTGSTSQAGDSMLVATESGSLFAFDATGVKMWEVNVGGQIYTSPVAAGDLIVVAPLNTDYLLAAVSKDGKLLWKFTGK